MVLLSCKELSRARKQDCQPENLRFLGNVRKLWRNEAMLETQFSYTLDLNEFIGNVRMLENKKSEYGTGSQGRSLTLHPHPRKKQNYLRKGCYLLSYIFLHSNIIYSLTHRPRISLHFSKTHRVRKLRQKTV